MKKTLSMMLVGAMVVSLFACGSKNTTPPVAETKAETTAAETKADDAAEIEATKMVPSKDFHIGIVAGSVSQFEDDRCGAEEFQKMHGEDIVKLAIYPDNFTKEFETTVQMTVNLSGDPQMKAIIINQSVPRTTEAFRKIKESHPDIICIAGEAHENPPEVGNATDLVCSNDFVVRGYLIIRVTHELGCDISAYISFPRHMTHETMSRCVAVMKEACKESGMEFILGTAPDPISDIGVAGAQAYILEKVPEWVEKYGKNAAYFCTNDAHTESLLKQLMEHGGYFIEADFPSPLMEYPGALGIDLTGEAGNSDKILAKVESTIVERGGADHSGTRAYSYGYTTTVGLAQHAMNVLRSESELADIGDIAKAYQVFFPKAGWNGSNYINVETGVKLNKVSLVYQDTYITGDSGHLIGSVKTEVPEKYFITK